MIGLQEMLERIFGKEMPPEITVQDSPVAKGRVVWWSENYKMLMDSMGICFISVIDSDLFGDPIMLFEELGEIYEAITGMSPETLFASAERAYQVERSFNALLGIDRKDDSRRGTKRGQEDPINKPGMLDEYYKYRGCSEQGIPTRKRLLEIGLSDVAEDLAKKGRLSEDECPAIEELLG